MNRPHSAYDGLPAPLSFVAASAISLLPALTLSVRGSANRLLFLLLLLSMIAAFWRHRLAPEARFAHVMRQYWPVWAALAAQFVAATVSTLAVGWEQPRVFADLRVLDTPLRMALFGPLFWLLLAVPAGWLKQLQWGCTGGALIGAAILHHQFALSPGERPMQILFSNLLPFSNITLLLGMFSLLSIGWSDPATRRGRIAIALKLAGGGAGLYVAYASGTRGGWLALAVFAFVFFFLMRGRAWRKLLAMATLAAASAGAYLSSDFVAQRVDDAYKELQEYRQGKELDSSVGNRLQLWAAAVEVFKEHPFVGVSRQGYGQAMQDAARRGIITMRAAEYRHSHNELLFNLATLGTLGALAILAAWLVPAAYFARAARSPHRDERTAGTMGLLLATGFLVFGMTEVMFAMSMVASFYTLMTAALMAIVARQRRCTVVA